MIAYSELNAALVVGYYKAQILLFSNSRRNRMSPLAPWLMFL